MTRRHSSFDAMTRARAALLLLVGGLVMHWLCYLPGAGQSGSRTAEAAHDYLLELTPALIAVAITLAAITALAPLALGRPNRASIPTLECRAARYGAALLAVFLLQEAAELFLAANAQSAFDAVGGPAAWLAPPLALFLGLAAALAARALERVEHRIAAAVDAFVRRRQTSSTLPGPSRVAGIALATLALEFGLARRPPPSFV